MTPESLAKHIKLLVLDVDGVLTDGGLIYDHDGNVSKRFYVADGLGIKMAQAAGLEIAVITGLNHGAVAARVRELGIEEYYAGNHDKLPLLEDLRSRKELEYEAIAYMGDDWVDAAVMRRVGLPMAVADAEAEIRDLARWVSPRPGGNGAVRDAVNFILASQGKLDGLWRRWAR
jgi:3-deoxy-D-manno-octulosonate 8-phosphate phosphatase (KDO 8-P phosphatase)